MFETVRRQLLAEAENSPTLLQDVAGLERYVAESYSARSLIELLQNADDAGARRVRLELVDGHLICANDGRAFTHSDLLALCRSASSTKRRGDGIGYRGIGFKSVVGVARTVHLLSGTLECTFSRTLTKNVLNVDHEVPLVRVPHDLVLSNGSLKDRLGVLQTEGYETIFVLSDLDLSKIRDELSRFDADYLLFLKNVKLADIVDGHPKQFLLERGPVENGFERVTVASPGTTERWVLLFQEEITIAFSADERGPVPLRHGQALVHAFLPTNEQSGFHVRLNADFSTDPSRTRIVLDERTNSLIESVADAIADLTRGIIENPTLKHAGEILSSLTPSMDEVSLKLGRRSLASDLIRAVSVRLGGLEQQLILPPSWMNADDAARLSPPDGKKIFPSITGLHEDAKDRICRMAGIARIGVGHILDEINAGKLSLSLTGQADLIAHLNTSTIDPSAGLTPTLVQTRDGGGVRTTAIELLRDSAQSSRELRQLLLARGIDTEGLMRRFGLPLETKKDASEPGSAIFSSGEVGIAGAPPAGSGIHLGGLNGNAVDVVVPTSSNASAWRAAELIVIDLLKELGYHAHDHTRQNVGYDIMAEGPTENLYIEVKSITYAGQPFALTPNEESFARESGSSFVIALVYRALDAVYVQFIPDARQSMVYVKQCRQWAWECSDYIFTPTHRVASFGAS